METDFWDSAEIPDAQPDWVYGWFADRKIGARVVDRFGVVAGDLIDGEQNVDAVILPYRDGATVVNRRGLGRRKPLNVLEGKAAAIFNIDGLVEDTREAVWAGSELDVMALAECGIDNAVSCTGLDALSHHASKFERIPRIVIGVGSVEREELARRLGRHRCWLVTWPTGRVDASDVLAHEGPEAVTAALAAAQPYPIEGLQRIKPGTLKALRRLPPPGTMTTGTRSVDAILKLPTEGRLIIVTGYPGAGKSSFVRFVMIHTAANHDRRWAVFSPEMQPWEQFVAECAEVWSGKTFWPIQNLPAMTDAEIEDAETWLANKVTMIVADAIDDAPTVDWLMERATAAVLRDGVTDFWIDPWNQVDHARGMGVTETEYIGRQLQRWTSFALRFGCNVWINVHPAKPQLKTGDTKGTAPGPYDINASAHWYNRADIGLTVHSPGNDRAEIHLWKSRFVRRWGKKGSVAALDFDPLVGRYSTPIPVSESTEPSFGY